MATQLKITYVGAGGSTSNTSSVTVNIPSALLALDSGQLASTQTGFNAADVAIGNIYKAGRFADGAGNWFSASEILTIAPQ